jgi:hypothetical protein
MWVSEGEMTEHRRKRRGKVKLPQGKRKQHRGRKHRGAVPRKEERERRMVEYTVSTLNGVW